MNLVTRLLCYWCGREWWFRGFSHNSQTPLYSDGKQVITGYWGSEARCVCRPAKSWLSGSGSDGTLTPIRTGT